MISRGAELTDPEEFTGPVDPAIAGPAGDLVTSGISPAGASGDNERRMNS